MRTRRTAPVPRAAGLRNELRRSYELLFRDPASTGSRRRDLADKALFLYQRDRWRWSPRRRLPSVDRIPIDRPIFLLGVQGGGLTLVSRALRRNRVVVTAGGDSSFWTGLDELGVEPSRMARLPTGLRGCKMRDDLEHPRFGRNHNSVYASPELLPLYRRTRADATDEDEAAFKRLIREHIAVYARNPAQARFLDKTQTYTVALSYLNALLSDCGPRFVLVTRNPYALALSAFRRPPTFGVPVSREEQIRLNAEHWAGSISAALDDSAETGHFLTVRFEDFTADPPAVLRRICDFADLAYDDDMVPQARHAMPRGTWPGDWKWYPVVPDRFLGTVTDEVAAIVEESCGELARRLGYSPAGAIPLAEPAVAS